MTLVYVGIALGIVGLLAEMAVDYRRQAAELKTDQDEVREQIANHQQRAQELKRKAEDAHTRIEGLQAEKRSLEKDLKVQSQLLEEREQEERTRNPTKFLFKPPEDGR